MKNSAKFTALVAVLIIVMTGCADDSSTSYPDLDLPGDITISSEPALVAGFDLPVGAVLTANYDGDVNVSYQWNRDEDSIPGANERTFTANQSGSYTVTVSARGYKSKTSDPVNVGNRYERGTIVYGESTSEAGITLIVIGVTEDYTGGEIEILAEIDGIPVTEIRERVFQRDGNSPGSASNLGTENAYIDGLPYLTSVIIPDSITKIGDRAFNWNKLTEITIPEGITDLPEYVFGNNLLTEIDIPDNVITIGNNAFYRNPITEITIGSGVTSIGEAAFYENKLTALVIPNKVTEIKGRAFYGNKLTSLTLGTGLTSLNDREFAYNNLFSLTIPANLTTIGDRPFTNNPLVEITIGVNVTVSASNSIPGNFAGTYNNEDTYNKKAGTYKRSVTPVDSETNLPSSTAWDIWAAESVFTVDVAGVLTAYSGSGGVVGLIPPSIDGKEVTAIGANAFENKNISYIALPSGITSIGNAAFKGNGIKSITIPPAVTEIGDSAFDGNSIARITFPKTVQDIGSDAFKGNPLLSVTIGRGVNLGNADSIPGGFKTLYESAEVDRAPGPYNRPTATGQWIYEGPDFDFDETTKTITGYNKSGGVVLIPVQLEDTDVAVIAANVFKNKSLTGVSFPGTGKITDIGNEAFRDNQLKGVGIPSTVTSLGIGAFQDNEMIGIIIGKGITAIPADAFKNNLLTEVFIPSTVTSIGADAFADNPLITVTIGANVTLAASSIPGDFKTFYDGISKAAGTYSRVDDTSTAWAAISSTPDGDFTFASGTISAYVGPEDADIVIPYAIGGTTVTAIAANAFYGSSTIDVVGETIKSVVIPAGVTEIGGSAFRSKAGRAALLTVIIYGPANIAEQGFRDQPNITAITIADSGTVLQSNAFRESIGVTSVTIASNVSILNRTALVNDDFKTFYESANNKAAGHYTRPSATSTEWVKEW